MGLLVLQELDLLFPLLGLDITAFSVAAVNCVDLRLQFNDLVVKLGSFGLQFNDTLL